MKLGDFQVCNLGIHCPDYFQGFGSGAHQNCVYGIGSDCYEALDDAMEQLAQFGIDFEEATQYELSTEDKIKEELEDDDACADGEAYYHVGIRFNSKEYDRYEELKELFLEVYDYSSYEIIEESRDNPLKRVWGYVKVADGSASYGNFHSAKWVDFEDYWKSVENSDDPSDFYVQFPHSTYSDYSGSTVEASNYKVLEEEYGEEDFFHPTYGGYSTTAAFFGVKGLLTCDDDTFEEFCEKVNSLSNYPVLDEQALSEYEHDKSIEEWDCWARSDFTCALEKKFDIDCIDIEDGNLYEYFMDCAENANCYWEADGPGMYIDIDRIVDSIEDTDILKEIGAKDEED